MFREGILLGSFVGDPFATTRITIEFSSREPQPQGRYVLLQSNRAPFKVDIEAFGGTTAFGGMALQTSLSFITPLFPESIILYHCRQWEVRFDP